MNESRLSRLFGSSRKLRSQLLTWFLIMSIIPLIVVCLLSFYQVRQTQDFIMAGEIENLSSIGESNAEFITAWLEVRQDEMRYLAELNAAQQMDKQEIDHLLQKMADAKGFYDTIFSVDANGVGFSGIEHAGGSARIQTEQEVNDFVVDDREWFQAAIAGNETFSQPLISRATGNYVVTVAVPIYQGGEIVGVMRGAVLLDTIMKRVQQLELGESAEVYLVDRKGLLVTPAESITNMDQAIETEASVAIGNEQSGSGIYANAQGTDVVGAYQYIPLLQWGLVTEIDQTHVLSEATSLRNQLMSLFTIIVIVCIVGIIVCALLIARSITRPVETIVEALQHVAEGDLTKRMEISLDQEQSRNEINRLAVHFNQMTSDLNQLTRSITNNSGMVARISEEVTASSEQTSHVSSEIATSIQEISSGQDQQVTDIQHAKVVVDEMSGAIQLIVDEIQTVADVATDTSQLAEEGKQVIDQSIEQMRKVSHASQAMGEVIQDLHDKTGEIEKVMDLIRHISEQTNLLALNASIEAARAGHHGRGFAVVADEIRKLAEQSNESTNQVNQIIVEIQEGSKKTVESNQSGQLAIGQCASMVNHAGECFAEITESVNNVSDRMQEVSSSTEQMKASSVELVRLIEQVSHISEQFASYTRKVAAGSEEQLASMEEIAASAQQLSGMAGELQELVKRFKTEDA
ncbi:hypothetical protein BEP19_00685 [Ammoniphilus oxalaticus]|uniref:Chemotaxis protein n=2 Tax=Ammoniphilus oxalaticus TaxID=66863 RepID=A0A419SRG1_9BACL|nr:hypothetical protein BEP19_00685 [Ammoniphilus oxalaticus]